MGILVDPNLSGIIILYSRNYMKIYIFCSVTPYMKEMPVLLKDTTALLIQFVLNMPPTMDQG